MTIHRTLGIDVDLVDPDKRLIATFVPQAWINDYAVDVDGRAEFDATDAYLALPAARRAGICDNTDSADNLVPPSVLHEHGGPYRVEIEDGLLAYHADESEPGVD